MLPSSSALDSELSRERIESVDTTESNVSVDDSSLVMICVGVEIVVNELMDGVSVELMSLLLSFNVKVVSLAVVMVVVLLILPVVSIVVSVLVTSVVMVVSKVLESTLVPETSMLLLMLLLLLLMLLASSVFDSEASPERIESVDSTESDGSDDDCSSVIL